jgi:hypothetical protein
MSPSREVRIESWEFDDLPAVVRGEAVRSLAATTPEMENLNQHNARMEIFREIREIYWTTDVPGQEIIRAYRLQDFLRAIVYCGPARLNVVCRSCGEPLYTHSRLSDIQTKYSYYCPTDSFWDICPQCHGCSVFETIPGAPAAGDAARNRPQGGERLDDAIPCHDYLRTAVWKIPTT